VPLPSIYTYKITFEGAPYFYFGVHKERSLGEEYWGSPVTHKAIWIEYVPVKEILSYYESWEEAAMAEAKLIRSFLNDPCCLNENASGAFSIASCKRGGKVGGKKAFESGQLSEAQRLGRLSMIRSGHFHSKIATAESRSKGGKIGGKTGGRKAVKSGQLRDAAKLAYSKTRKPIFVKHLETDEDFYFESLGLAAEALNLHKSGLCAVANGRWPSYKGYVAEYL